MLRLFSSFLVIDILSSWTRLTGDPLADADAKQRRATRRNRSQSGFARSCRKSLCLPTSSHEALAYRLIKPHTACATHPCPAPQTHIQHPTPTPQDSHLSHSRPTCILAISGPTTQHPVWRVSTQLSHPSPFPCLRSIVCST